MSGTTGTESTNYTYNSACYNRLPCGICRLTNAMCPLQQNWTVHPTWSLTCDVELGTGTNVAKTDEVSK